MYPIRPFTQIPFNRNHIPIMKQSFCLLLFLLIALYTEAQPRRQNRYLVQAAFNTPHLALKTNLLHDVITSMHLGLEAKTGMQQTVEMALSYNPWTFSENRKWKHLLLQPEYRYWLCEAFYGHYLGLHAHYAYYNVGRLPFGGSLKTSRYEGWLLGAGFTYGYHWMLSNRWSLEANVGVGYAYLDYEKYPCGKCSEKLKDGNRHYFGVTKASVSLIYIIK